MTNRVQILKEKLRLCLELPLRELLPEKLLQKLFETSTENLLFKVNPSNLWCSRHVQVIDCSTVSMPDTAENQKAYLQSGKQKEGCGFSIAKIGVLFSLATGAAVALSIDSLNTNDIKLARRLYQLLKPLDVLLGDSAFCSSADFFWLRQRGCDAVIRKYNGRCQRLQGGFIVTKNGQILTLFDFEQIQRVHSLITTLVFLLN